jgi:hypothetical protein
MSFLECVTDQVGKRSILFTERAGAKIYWHIPRSHQIFHKVHEVPSVNGPVTMNRAIDVFILENLTVACDKT